MTTQELERVRRLVDEEGGGRLLVITGAGVSRASGIPTFRGDDPEAVWHRSVTELGTLALFRRDPVASWRHYQERFGRVLAAEPNPAHRALAALERWQVERGGELLLVTQNVDLLHEAAGSGALVKAHGSADRVRCPRDGCRHGGPSGSLPRPEAEVARFLADPTEAAIPRCPGCGELLRPHVLWFDESYASHRDYGIERIEAWAGSFDLVLFVGTSFSVGLTELVLVQGLIREAPMVVIDPGAGPPLERHRTYRTWPELEERRMPPPRVVHLRGAAEDVLPALVAGL